MTPKKYHLFTLIALGYLALPNVLFLLTWVNLLIGIPVAAVFLWSIFPASEMGDVPSERQMDRRTILIAAVFAIGWTILSGVGGLVPQSSDYLKHSVLFHDLVHLSWPVIYHPDTPQSSFLCYGVAYYLVPSGIARFLGDGSINALSFLWACSGIGLCFYWLACFNPKSPARTLLIFICFSTFGIAWYVFKRGHLEYFKQLGIEHSYLDHWAKLYFTPQHGISGWLGAAIIYDLGWMRKKLSSAFLAWASLLLWSPFVCVGLAPVLLVTALRIPFRRWFSIVPLAGGLLLMSVMGLFFSAHQPLEHKGFIWSLSDGGHWLTSYLLFVLLEVLLPAGCVLYFDYKHRILEGWRPLFLCAFVVLLLFPLYKMGRESDLRLQGSGSALVFMALGSAAGLTSPKFSFRSVEGLMLFTLFAVSAVYPLGRPLLNLKGPADDYRFETIQRTMDVHDMSEIGKTEPNVTFDFAQQYLGRKDSAAFRWLLRK